MLNKIKELFKAEYQLPDKVAYDLAEKFLKKAPSELVDALLSKGEFQYRELSLKDVTKVFDIKSFVTACINMASCVDDDSIYKEVVRLKELEHEVEKLYETE